MEDSGTRQAVIMVPLIVEAFKYWSPNGVAVDEQTGNMFVVDINNRHIVSLATDGQVRWTLGPQNGDMAKSPFNITRSAAVDPNGPVYVSDAPDRIVILDQDGNLVSIVGERGTENTQLNYPEGIYVTDDSRLQVAGRENNRVQVWDLSAELDTADLGDVEISKEALRNYQ